MNWKIVIEKFLKGLATAIAGVIASYQPALVDWVADVVPGNLDPQGTIIAVVVALIVAITNILKHWGK